MQTRAKSLGINIIEKPREDWDFTEAMYGCLIQYPDGNGEAADHTELILKAHEADVKVVFATDLMALLMLKSPGEMGADVVVGSSQRFGVPMGYRGPHAAFFAADESYKRNFPGRIIGVSVDRHGDPAIRMALQTREQHIRRDKATSNIYTAQALLAVAKKNNFTLVLRRREVLISADFLDITKLVLETLNARKKSFKLPDDISKIEN